MAYRIDDLCPNCQHDHLQLSTDNLKLYCVTCAFTTTNVVVSPVHTDDVGTTTFSIDNVTTPTPVDNVTTFSTGARRGTSCLPFHLLPPGFISAVRAGGLGSAKYGDYNNLKGLPLSNLFDHAITHLLLFWWGDKSEDHLGHCLWNINQMAFQLEGDYDRLDDRPPSAIKAETIALVLDKMKEDIRQWKEANNLPLK